MGAAHQRRPYYWGGRSCMGDVAFRTAQHWWTFLCYLIIMTIREIPVALEQLSTFLHALESLIRSHSEDDLAMGSRVVRDFP